MAVASMGSTEVHRQRLRIDGRAMTADRQSTTIAATTNPATFGPRLPRGGVEGTKTVGPSATPAVGRPALAGLGAAPHLGQGGGRSAASSSIM